MRQTTSIFLFLTMITGTLMVVTTEKWFLVWIGLEMSTLALIPLLCSKFTPRKMEASMKYFLIQALSAAILLKMALMQAWTTGSWSTLEPLKKISSLLLLVALSFKLGLAPCHFWLPDVLQGLPFIQGLMMSTWQKMAPLMILFSFNALIFSKIMMILGMLSVIMGGWGGLNQTQTRKMLAFSSISHMGWMTTTSVYSFKAALVMLILYLIMKTTMFLLLNLLKVSTLGHLNMTSQLYPMSTSLLMLTVLSLGGLPPLTGFMIKLISLYFLITKNFLILSSLLMTGSLLSLFFYLRMVFNTSLLLFPHHILALTSWRNHNLNNQFPLNTWVTSFLFMASTISTPLIVPLYMIM